MSRWKHALWLAGFLLPFFSCNSLKKVSDEYSGPDGPANEKQTQVCYRRNEVGMKDPQGEFIAMRKKNDAGLVELDQGQAKNDEGENYYYYIGGGCILDSIEVVWARMHSERYMRWEGEDEKKPITQKSLEELPEAVSSEEVSHYYRSKHHRKHKKIIPIDWKMDWFHFLKKGSFESPSVIEVQYQKIHGVKAMHHWAGSIILEKINEEVTSIKIQSEFGARKQGAERPKAIFDELVKDASKAPTVKIPATENPDL